MFLNLLASSGLFTNQVDIVFFSAILIVVVLLLVVFIASKIVQKQRDKKYEALEAQNRAALEDNQEVVQEASATESALEAVVEEASVAEPAPEVVVEEASATEPAL